MFEAFRKHETDPLICVPDPLAKEPSVPEAVAKGLNACCASVSMNFGLTELHNWSTSLKRDTALTGFSSSVTFEIQRELGLTKNAATAHAGLPPVDQFKWLQMECVSAAAQRCALAQRTFNWALLWSHAATAAAKVSPPVLYPGACPTATTLFNDIELAKPILTDLAAKMADGARRTDKDASTADRLTERTETARFLLAGLSILAPFLASKDQSFPPNEPPRELAECLGHGSAWLIHQLHENGSDLTNDLLNLWRFDNLASTRVIVGNGMDLDDTPPALRGLAEKLGVSLITDAEGITDCSCSAPDAIDRAKADPSATTVAVYCEAHMLRFLNAELNAAFASGVTRNAMNLPKSLPTPESSLLEKCEWVVRCWSTQQDLS